MMTMVTYIHSEELRPECSRLLLVLFSSLCLCVPHLYTQFHINPKETLAKKGDSVSSHAITHGQDGRDTGVANVLFTCAVSYLLKRGVGVNALLFGQGHNGHVPPPPPFNLPLAKQAYSLPHRPGSSYCYLTRAALLASVDNETNMLSEGQKSRERDGETEGGGRRGEKKEIICMLRLTRSSTEFLPSENSHMDWAWIAQVLHMPET